MCRYRAHASAAARFLAVISIIAIAVPPQLLAETITLKNGTRLEGDLAFISSIGVDPLAAAGPGEVKLKRIMLCDDNLRRTFVGKNQIATEPIPSPAIPMERIRIKQTVSAAGRNISSVGTPVNITPFDEWGRRIFTMSGPMRNIDIVQGITEITPHVTKVEAVGQNSYNWTMRIATSSIPRDTLSKILLHSIDRKNSDQRLMIVRLYMQSERIQDARAELEQLIADFPKLAHLNETVKSLNQLGSQRLLKEVQVRKDAGQHELAYAMLDKFPTDGVAGETLLKVREMLDEYKESLATRTAVLKQMKALFDQLKDDDARSEITPICDEIAAELNVNTLDRMADFMRLVDDKSLSPDQKLSLAISGWLLGSGSGIDNLAVSKSLVQVRRLARQYLSSSRTVDRAGILEQLKNIEGSSPANVAKIVAHMKPPFETLVAQAPMQVDVGNVKEVLGPKSNESRPEAKPESPKPRATEPPAAPKPQPVQPKAAGVDLLSSDCAPKEPLDDSALLLGADPGAEPADKKGKAAEKPALQAPAPAPAGEPIPLVDGIPGLLSLSVPGLPEDPKISYLVQLPPEYDPYRRYPVVVTLNGGATTPRQQLDWWAGAYNANAKTRYGQATRYGYIVVAPQWTREHQRKYEFSAREHAAVLYSLRDVCRRFAVDTDRVFLSGHSMGGDAAWDIALAHPDLWAGVMPIVATADKYVTRYWENAEFVSFYFVSGEKDSNKHAANAIDWDRYLLHSGFDTTIVQYQGRGHEHFHDEIQKLLDWMNLHRRNFFPKEFKAVTMRPWDNFFWWAELGSLPSQSMVMPVSWPPGSAARPAITEATILSTNSVRVTSGAQKVTVYLAPEMVNFEERVNASINGRRVVNIQPSVDVLLEDARTRGDRLHPFWAKVEN